MTEADSDRSVDSLSIPLPSLHGSLMRSRIEKDPYRYYEKIKVIGEGSMGSVIKVHKRESVMGGSARTEFVEEEKRRSRWWRSGLEFPCFGICPRSSEEESKDDLLQMIEENAPPYDVITPPYPTLIKNQSHRTSSDSSHASTPLSSSMITYGRKDAIYALKSIQVSRVRDSIYREELLNEIEILQTLDHPNIVKAIVRKGESILCS